MEPSRVVDISAQRSFLKNAIEILIMEKKQEGLRAIVAKPLVMEAIDLEFAVPEPTMVLHKDSAQILMDELWDCGLRPTEGSGSAGSLRATERHLEDMQKIVAALLKKDGVEL